MTREPERADAPRGADVVRIDDQDVLVMPQSKFDLATVKQHFWEPTAPEQ